MVHRCLFRADRAAGDGCRRQGRHHQARDGGVNPQGCQVFCFKKPSAEEAGSQLSLALHARAARARPNRHLQPVLLRGRPRRPRPPGDPRPPEAAQRQRRPQVLGRPVRRHQPVRASPRAQRHAGAEVLPATSRRRSRRTGSSSACENRRSTGSSRTAISRNGSRWDDYQGAFADMLQHTSTKWAPWWVIPADHKWVTRALVGGIITESHQRAGLKKPTVSAEQRRLIAQATPRARRVTR